MRGDELLSTRVLSVCGVGKILVIGEDVAALVRDFLIKGANCWGLFLGPASEAMSAGQISPRFYYGPLKDHEFGEDSFDTVVLFGVFDSQVPLSGETLASIHRITRTNFLVNVSFRSKGLSRADLELAAFRVGFRKHALYYKFVDYRSLEMDHDKIEVAFEKISHNVLENFPLEELIAQRNLHMDMSRESGRRSDGHIFRYQYAAYFIRPGDVVLDIACGLGYGSSVLAKSHYARQVIGVDSSKYAIDYARNNFSATSVEFFEGSAEKLDSIASASVDFVVSFETLEHLVSPEQFLHEAFRVLKPTGRIFISVPNNWIDPSTGKDPNPHHLHVYDLERVRTDLGRLFIIEKIVAQHAGGGFKCPELPRLIREVSCIEDEVSDAEWILCLAMKSPIGDALPEYEETSYPIIEDKSFLVADFKRHFSNPWLYKSILSKPWRLSGIEPLEKVAEEIIASSSPASTDAAAGLAVLGYILHDSPQESSSTIEQFIGRAESWLANNAKDCADPLKVRWTVSLLALQAKLFQKIGDFSNAKVKYKAVLDYDPKEFSPILSIKTVEASFILGMWEYQERSISQARNYWIFGMEAAKQALQADYLNVIGSTESPLDFGFPELSIIAEFAGKCAFGIQSLSYLECPGFAFDMWNDVASEKMALLRLEKKTLAQSLGKYAEDFAKFQKVINETRESHEKSQKNYEETLARYEEGFAEFQKVIREIHESTGWRILTFVRGLRDMLLRSVGSKRSSR